MSKSLFKEFKEIYFSEFKTLEIAWSELDRNGNLNVGIRDKNTKKIFFLHIRKDEKGNIYWY